MFSPVGFLGECQAIEVIVDMVHKIGDLGRRKMRAGDVPKLACEVS